MTREPSVRPPSPMALLFVGRSVMTTRHQPTDSEIAYETEVDDYDWMGLPRRIIRAYLRAMPKRLTFGVLQEHCQPMDNRLDGALCAAPDVDPEDFFHAGRGRDPDDVDRQRRALDLCVRCPVMYECQRIGMKERYGIWGGLTEKDRAQIRRRATTRTREWVHMRRKERSAKWREILRKRKERSARRTS